MKTLLKEANYIIKDLKNKDGFVRRFAITLSGSSLVTLIGFLITPIMSRLYTPDVYGNFALFNSIITNLNLLTTLTYPGAFLQPKTENRFFHLVQLTCIIIFFTCTSIFIVNYFFGEFIIKLLHLESLGRFYYLVPLLLLIFNLNIVMSEWYVRDKAFTKRASIDFAATSLGRLYSVSYGLLINGTLGGLIFGDLLNRLISNIGLFFTGIHKKAYKIFSNISFESIKSVALEYREFPLHALPSNYLNTLSAQLPIFALNIWFGPTVVGLYSFAMGLLEIPINLLYNATYPVFLQKAYEIERDDPSRLSEISYSLYSKLLYIGLIPFGVITLFGDIIFGTFFGKHWIEAGIFTSYLGFYYASKLTSSVTNAVYNILREQRILLISNTLLTIFRLTGLGIGIYMKDLHLSILLFATGSTIITILTNIYAMHLLGIPIAKVTIRTIGLIAATFTILKFIRVFLIN